VRNAKGINLYSLLKSASLIFLLFIICGSDPVLADEVVSPRDSLKIPTKKMYEQILSLAKDGDFEKISQLVDEMAPVLKYLNEKYQYNAFEALKRGCDQKNADLVRTAVQAAVYRDVLALLDEAETHSGDSLRVAQTDIRMARLTYEIVAPDVRKSDLVRDERIKKYFVDAYRMTTSNSPYSDAGQSDNERLSAVLDNISLEIKEATPPN
jgi:hypothetical protein